MPIRIFSTKYFRDSIWFQLSLFLLRTVSCNQDNLFNTSFELFVVMLEHCVQKKLYSLRLFNFGRNNASSKSVAICYFSITYIVPLRFFWLNSLRLLLWHCVKSVQIRSFGWSVFSHIRTEYGQILPHSTRMRENTDQKKLRIWTLFTQWEIGLKQKPHW